MDKISGRMKQEENMLDVREIICLKNICVVISFDGVNNQELMRKIHAA